MASMRIAAHFDGNQIILDEPIALEPDTKLIVTVLPKYETDEQVAWATLSVQGLANAYGDDEVEYTLDSVKEVNSAYAGR